MLVIVMINQNNIIWYLLMLVYYKGTGWTGCGHLVMYCTSHTLSGKQVLIEEHLHKHKKCIRRLHSHDIDLQHGHHW